MTRKIDLRSDTVTLPTLLMRVAMATAKLGDDVFREDPTVVKLEEKAAKMMGQQSGLFVSSGTMANLLAIIAQCRPGHSTLAGEMSHIYSKERHGIEFLRGQILNTAKEHLDATMTFSEVEASLLASIHRGNSVDLVCIENTHTALGGVPIESSYIQSISELCHQYHAKIHMDGARIFNAAVSLGVPPMSLAGKVDSVSFCLSKGLSAPVGAVLCGSKDFIEEARQFRKFLGGGMCQVGVLAAAGIVALDNMIEKLEKDHANAKYLANNLAGVDGFFTNIAAVRTNIVDVEILPGNLDAHHVAHRFAKNEILVRVNNPHSIRLVTHAGITHRDIRRVITVFEKVSHEFSTTKMCSL